MPDHIHEEPDAGLEAALRDLGAALAFPTGRAGGPDLATRVRLRIESRPQGTRAGWLRRLVSPVGGPARRSLILALVALAVLAAVAGAAILGLPGIRLVPLGGPAPTATPPASARPSLDRPPGTGIGLGEMIALDEAAAIVGFEPLLPAGFGPPEATWVLDRRLSFVWAARPGEPEIAVEGASLLITEFRGRVGDAYYEKAVHQDTTLEPVVVAGRPGYWLSGRPHVLFYVDEDGKRVDETSRIVGDALIWEVDGLTFRIESALGREATIGIAEGLAPEG